MHGFTVLNSSTHNLKLSSIGHPVSSYHPFTQQVTSPKQVTLGASILGLSFLRSSYPPQWCNSLSSSSSPVWLKIQESLKIVVETTCQPILKDHGSHRLERKRRFSLATPIAKSFTFVWLLWKDKLAKHLLISRKLQARTSPTFLIFYFHQEVASQTCLRKFLACYFRRELFWSLHVSCFLVLSSFQLAQVWWTRTLLRTPKEVYLEISKFLKRMQL